MRYNGSRWLMKAAGMLHFSTHDRGTTFTRQQLFYTTYFILHVYYNLWRNSYMPYFLLGSSATTSFQLVPLMPSASECRIKGKRPTIAPIVGKKGRCVQYRALKGKVERVRKTHLQRMKSPFSGTKTHWFSGGDLQSTVFQNYVYLEVEVLGLEGLIFAIVV